LAGAPEKAATPPTERRTKAMVADVNFILLFVSTGVVMLLRMMYRIGDRSIDRISPENVLLALLAGAELDPPPFNFFSRL
jgi:hypothetical protein